MQLQIIHETVYRYSQPVRLGPHRLMLRAAEGHDVQIRSSSIAITPEHRIRWIHDVFGNSIALVDLLEPTTELRITSQLLVEQYNTNPFDFALDPSADYIPFSYDPQESLEVEPYQKCIHPEDRETVRHWLQPFLQYDGRAKTLDFLFAINKSFPHFFQYVQREEPGVQTPGETLRRRSGSCRDFAFLLMEGARQLGLASRYVSGYLCNSPNAAPAPASTATHAWAQVYLPGAGWKGLDPTCGLLASDHHVRVAVARHPTQATPVQGSFQGDPTHYLGMEIRVDARALPDPKGSAAS